MAQKLFPGPASKEGLRWLARVGPCPSEVFRLAMGWNGATTWSHVQRLEAVGWLTKTQLGRGMGGPLLAITDTGAMQSAVTSSAPKSPIAPTWWAHWSGCAWVAAWLHVREREWIGAWEIREESEWSGSIQYRDYRGSGLATHQPDLVGAGNPIEVELTRKAKGRLDAILGLYKSWRDAGRISGVLYVVNDHAAAKRVSRAADRVGLPIRIEQLADVMAQTRALAERAPGAETVVS